VPKRRSAEPTEKNPQDDRIDQEGKAIAQQDCSEEPKHPAAGEKGPHTTEPPSAVPEDFSRGPNGDASRKGYDESIEENSGIRPEFETEQPGKCVDSLPN
jgi:hypothetical protein